MSIVAKFCSSAFFGLGVAKRSPEIFVLNGVCPQAASDPAHGKPTIDLYRQSMTITAYSTMYYTDWFWKKSVTIYPRKKRSPLPKIQSPER